MKIRTVIVDDEDLARRGIRVLLESAPDVEIVAECGDAGEAIEAIRTTAPDLVFLDVQMPGQSGFEVLDAIDLAHRPHIVFVTAFEEFAIRAFEVSALDYIVKPVSDQRFALALQRARYAMASARDESIGRRLGQLAATLGQAPAVGAGTPDRIPVKADGRVMVIRISEIDWIKAEHDHVALYVGSQSWRLREAISSFEARFADAGFVRIHRSTLVNVDRIRELRPLEKGEFQVILQDGVELKLSRNYRSALPRIAGTAI